MNHHQDHDQSDSQNHDDCENCKKQKAQNQKLISIYEQLQLVNQRASGLKSSLLSHQHRVSQNYQTFSQFSQKVEKTKNQKKQKGTSQLQQIGFQLYADSIQKQRKSPAQKQNQRLQIILKNIYRERSAKTHQKPVKYQQEQKSLMKSSVLLPKLNKNSEENAIFATQWFQRNQNSSRTESRKSQSFVETSLGKSFEVSSTKSSFNTTKRKIFQKKDFEELNLWLFDKRNQILQKELYEQHQGNIIQNDYGRQLNRSKVITRYINNVRRQKNSQLLREDIIFSKDSDSQKKKIRINNSMMQALPQRSSYLCRFKNTRMKKEAILPIISSSK